MDDLLFCLMNKGRGWAVVDDIQLNFQGTPGHWWSWGRIAHCAHAVCAMHKVCTGPYPNCIVVLNINNNAVTFTAILSQSARP